MIPIDFRAHVIDWKMQAHLRTDKSPTKEEWSAMKSIPKEMRFQCGEEISSEKFFWAYIKTSRNGMYIASKKAFDLTREKSRQSAKKRAKKHNESGKHYYQKNKKKVLERTSKYAKKNRERGRAVNAVWKKENPEKIKRYYRNAWLAQKSDPQKHILKKIRLRITSITKHRLLYGRSTDSESVKFLIWLADYQKINALDGFDIDHIIPLSKTDLSTKEAQIKANSPENVRWLKRSDNIAKRDRMPSQQEIDDHLAVVSIWRSQKDIIR
jgi:hypothetical protein